MTTFVLRFALPLCLLARQAPSRRTHRLQLPRPPRRRPIGRHVFRVSDDGAGRAVDIEADFDVRVLFVPLYRYRHRNVERWEDGCLFSVFDTDDNYRDFAVRRSEPDCVTGADGVRGSTAASAAAYRDPRFLESSRLLNSQDGSFVPCASTCSVPTPRPTA